MDPPMDRLFEPALHLDVACELGECPRWHPGERALYWVDIAARTLHRSSPAQNDIESRTFDVPVACFAFRAGGGLVLGMKDGCALIDHLHDAPRPFGPQPLAGRPHHRMNDGRTDAQGRFWVGSVNSAKDAPDATLYRLDPDGALSPVESGMITCNGAAFSSDGRFAHSDTPSHRVRVYDVDGDEGAITNGRTLHQFDARTSGGVGPGLGRPDGGSFDAEGNYWCALFDGWRVVQIAPDGTLLRSIALPVARPTMIAFGGDDRRTAYVTSAWTGLDAAARAAQPHAGAIFAFRVATPGLAEHPFAA